MTERWALWMMIGGPVALMAVIGVIMGVSLGDPVLGVMVFGGGLLTVGVIYGFAAAVVRLMTRRQREVFEALAQAYDGEVQRNFMGEMRLVLTGPAGTAWIEWRALQQADADGRIYRAWTRLQLRLTPSLEPGTKIALSRPLPQGLGDEARASVQAIRAKLVTGSLITLRGREKHTLAQVWMPSYIDDEQVIGDLVAVVIPELVRLAVMPQVAQAASA